MNSCSLPWHAIYLSGAILILPSACGPDGSGDTASSAPDEASGTSEGSDETGASVDEFDCASISGDPPAVNVIDGAIAGRGLAFDDTGRLVGVSEPHLFVSDYKDSAELFVSNLGELDQIDRLSDGDYVLANFGTGALMRIKADGTSSVIVTEVFAYGVRVGPDGMIYAANGSTVSRFDPQNGDKTVVVDASGAGWQARVVDFSVDHSRLFIGTQESGGRIYVQALDDDLSPVGEPTVFVDSLGDWHDGIGVDICDNIYLVDYFTKSLYRISPDGSDIRTLMSASADNGQMFAHGIAWGSGIGGWKSDALYLPLPSHDDGVAEALIGIPHRSYEGIAHNAP